MDATRGEARQKVADLVAAYEHLTPAQVKTYNEARTKQHFVLPLFQALGWDIFNTDEVTPEESASKGRVDYAFKLKGVPHFYLEAKPLRADIGKPEYVQQAVTYAYNKGVIWAALTDFESLRVFNAQTGHPFLNLSHQDYLKEFDRLWWLSRESVGAGVLNQEAAKVGALPPPQPVEKRLFGLLRQWREELSRQLYLHNPHLTPAQVDETILRLFNRLIFIRNCEDRGIEERVLIAALNRWESGGRKGELIEALREIFRQFDGYYDSDLFMLHPVDQVFIESNTLADIIRGLYEVPGGLASYDFSVIDADVLGAVYEQYLGHVASIAKQRAQQAQARLSLGLPAEVIELEAKRQKRKEQGIYYTPKWVTEYIVRQTVGRFIAERSHNEVLNIKILDPACGSGSFLIRAYDELLRYHASVRGKSAAELDQFDRLPVLTGNIFGVDLDMQAVEIARLNLLLRSLARREVLPSLADNIRQGNSLISGGEAELRPYFGDAWQEKKPFNWEQEFPDIMKGGGFDVVIGNPPYVRIQSLPREEADYYRERFESAYGSFDLYVLFLERGIKLLKPGGRLGFICSGKFLKSQYGRKVQEYIHREGAVESIVDLSAQTVFAESTTYPAIVIVRKGKGEEPLSYISVPAELADLLSAPTVDLAGLPVVTTDQVAITRGVWPPAAKDDPLLVKLSINTKPLGEVAERIFQGLITSADKVYILEKRGGPKGGLIRVYSRATGKEHQLEAALLKPLLTGKNIARYGTPAPTHLLLFPYRVSQGKTELIPAEEFSNDYPRCWQYLRQNRSTLEDREQGKMRHERWYAYVYPKNLALHDLRKLAIPRLVKHLEAVYDADGSFYLDNVDVGGVILKEGGNDHYLYVLALLHSRLLDFCFRRISAPFRGGFRSANRQFIEPLPIRLIDPADPAQKRLHDELVSLVEKMLELHKRLAEVSPFEEEKKRELEREIQRTDQRIDSLVYDLYGLTGEERRLVESQFS